MARKIYKRIGLRRDKNFGDLSSAEQSLNNLLDGLVDDVDDTFVSEDLNAIRNINNTGLTNGHYKSVTGSTTLYTAGDGTNIAYKPHITYQNKIDQFAVFSGNPRLSGGDGLTAKYWQKDQILKTKENSADGPNFEYWQNTNSSASEVLAGVTTMGQIPNDNHWEKGDFDYTGKLHPQSVLTDGGVTWEGYFVPTRTGVYHFLAHTTGYVTFDFNLDGYEEDLDNNQTAASIAAVGAGNTYKEWARLGITTTFTASASANSNTITIEADKSKTIGIGMSVSGSGLLNDGTVWPTIEEYQNNINGSTSTVTLKPVPGQTNSVGGSNFTNNSLTFSRDLGNECSVRFPAPYMVQYRKYRIRARFFFPKDVDTSIIQRKISFAYELPGGSSADIYFHRLFPLDYKFAESEKGDFNKYFDTSVRFGGTDPIGIGGTSGDSNSYVKIYTNNKVQAKYAPKTTLSAITKIATQACTGVSGSVVLECSSTGGIEVGNYVFGPNTDDSTNIVREGARIIEIIVNDSLILDKPCGSSGTQNLRFIDHRGFVKRVKGAATASGGTTVNFASGYKTDTTDLWKIALKKDMIVLTTPQSGTDVPSYTRITAVNDSDTITLSNGMSNSANTLIYIYQSRGLIDRSLESFCPQSGGATTRCHPLSAIAAKDQNQIQLVSVSGLGNNLIVEGFGIPAGTEIDSISGNTLTLSANLTKDINAGATVTIHESSLTGDRQLCCPPTDTSPPFSATPNGLISPDDKRNLSLTQGNLKFDELKFKFPNDQTGKIAVFSTSDPVDRQIHIRTAPTPDQTNGLFYLLGKTV